MSKKEISRKEFLSYTALIGATGAIGITPLLTSCAGKKETAQYVPLKSPGEYYVPNLIDKAVDGKPLKAGLIGCGGRGSGAAENFLNAGDSLTIVALGDVFQDRVDGMKNHLKTNRNMDIPDNMCFVGFDAYKNVIDAGVDVVIIATPPYFRPEHFRYATEKGVHSFLEKPITVDPVGYRTIVAAAKQADAKGLCVVTGTQRHHQRNYVEAYKKIMEGYIGEITGGEVYWNQSMLWYKEKDKKWSNMEWMIRDWVNWKWLSGDHIVEQHVHNIDVFTWFSGLKPVSAVAFGGRHRRITGDQYDNFSVDFIFENGIHMHSMCRQINGCKDNVSEFIQGTKGSWNSATNEIKDLQGNVVWKYDGESAGKEFTQHDPYVLEHINWVSCIRNNTPINQAKETAVSNLAAIMGRESAYTGQEVTWDEMSASDLSYAPVVLEMANVDMSGYTVPVPGK